MGLVVSSFGFTRVVGEIPGSILTDRIGRTPLILLGYVLSSASHMIGGFSQSHIELMVFRMILGMGSGIQLTASLTCIGDITSSKDRRKHVALFQSTYSTLLIRKGMKCISKKLRTAAYAFCCEEVLNSSSSR